MKKFILVFLLLILGTYALADDRVFSPVYATKLFHCFPDSNSFKLGEDYYKTHSDGWSEDGKCIFDMTVTDAKKKTTNYSCQLTRSNVDSLYSAIKSDPMGQGVAKQLFEKYRKNRNICNIQD